MLITCSVFYFTVFGYCYLVFSLFFPFHCGFHLFSIIVYYVKELNTDEYTVYEEVEHYKVNVILTLL